MVTHAGLLTIGRPPSPGLRSELVYTDVRLGLRPTLLGSASAASQSRRGDFHSKNACRAALTYADVAASAALNGACHSRNSYSGAPMVRGMLLFSQEYALSEHCTSQSCITAESRRGSGCPLNLFQAGQSGRPAGSLVHTCSFRFVRWARLLAISCRLILSTARRRNLLSQIPFKDTVLGSRLARTRFLRYTRRTSGSLPMLPRSQASI